MSADEKLPSQKLEDFLLDYLPWGTPMDCHELLEVMIEAARAKIAEDLRKRDELRPEDEDDQPARA